jgi:hypothetical protein
MDRTRALGFAEEPEAIALHAAERKPPPNVVLVFVELRLKG